MDGQKFDSLPNSTELLPGGIVAMGMAGIGNQVPSREARGHFSDYANRELSIQQ